MKQTTLLIMAAGIGSRFGTGIKQLEPVGLHDEIIMDYSIHDAIEVGFNKIIFVIRKDIEADFRERIGDRVEGICGKLGVEIAYAYQDIKDIPCVLPSVRSNSAGRTNVEDHTNSEAHTMADHTNSSSVPVGRTKPWGTGQAVLSAKNLLTEPFAVINADDYYGKEAFRQMHDWLILEHEDSAIAMAGFILKNTLSDNGGVTRGICKVEDGHTHIVDVVETGNIVKVMDSLTGTAGSKGCAVGSKGCAAGSQDSTVRAVADGVELDPESYVSMNFWGFPAKEGCAPAYLDVLEQGFVEFFAHDVKENPLKAEYLLPTHIGGLLRAGKCSVKVLETKDKWFGVTYKEDKEAVMQSFRKLISDGVYSEELYEDLISCE